MDNYKMSDVKIDFLTKHNRKLLIELICNEQTHMIVKIILNMNLIGTKN